MGKTKEVVGGWEEKAREEGGESGGLEGRGRTDNGQNVMYLGHERCLSQRLEKRSR